MNKMAKNQYETAPLKNKSTELKYDVAIYVPSTEMDKPVKDKVYKERVDETRIFLDKKGGGDTTTEASGGYYMSKDKKLVKEDVTIVRTSFKSKEDYEKAKPQIEKYIVKKRTDYKQDSMAYEYENNTYIYPKFDKQ